MSESVDDIEIDEEGLGSVEAVEEVFAEFEEESERHARTVEQYEETSPETGMDSNYGSYDRETGSIYLDGMELQGSDDKIEGIKEKFKEGFEGLADWSEGEWNGVTYRTDYHIEGSILRLDTYVIEVNEAGSLDSGMESDTGSEGGDEDEPIAASNILDTQARIEDGQEIFGEEDQITGESTDEVEEVTAWSSWLETGVENSEPQAEKTEVTQAQNPLVIERPVLSFDNLFNIEVDSPAQAEVAGLAVEGRAEITGQPEQHLNEEEDLSIRTEFVEGAPTESATDGEDFTEQPEARIEFPVVSSQSREQSSPQRILETYSPISLKTHDIKQTESSPSVELPKTEEVLASESAPNQENEEAALESSYEILDSENTVTTEWEAKLSQKIKPITLAKNIRREANIAEVKTLFSEEAREKEFPIERDGEFQQITHELAELIERPTETHAEANAKETLETPAIEASGIELASAEKQEPTLKEPDKARQLETQGAEVQDEQKVQAETIQETTNQVEKKITEVRRAIRLVKAQTKKIEQVVRERTQAERIYEPIREIRRVIINGPRLETGGIILRRNRSVISTEERDRLENANRIVEIPRYNSRRRTPNRSTAIRLAV